MLRVAAKTQCNDAWSCPTIFQDTAMADDAYVQGDTDIPADVLEEATPPAGERIVRVPRAMVIEAGRQFEREQLFARADTLFRLETQPAYQLNPDAAGTRFQAFLHGEAIPARTPDTSPWLAQIARGVAAGRTWHRVHVISEPLTDLMRYELVTDLENVAAGERVLVADRTTHPWMKGLTQDFWGFDLDDPDRATALLMRYDDAGRLLDAEISTDPDIIKRCRRRRDLVLPRAIPVEDYLKQLDVGVAPETWGVEARHSKVG
jgi:hypothetical protein